MALTAEQIAEARSEGYSDAEILDHYAKTSGVDLAAARKEGYSNSEILSHLSGAEVTPELEVVEGKSALSNPALSGALGAGAGAVYSAKTLPVKAAKAFGTAVANRMAPQAAATPSPATYTTPSGIPVEQTPGGLHPGAVGNAQFNIEQQQANQLRQNMPSGFEQRGTSRIITPMGMEEPTAAPSRTPSTQSMSTVNRLRKEGWPIVRETATQAAKSTAPVVGNALRGVATSNPVAGAMAAYNLQDALNRSREGDIAGATIGGAGTAASLLPKMKGKMGLIKPVVGAGAALVNKLRGEPESVMNKSEGGVIAPHLEHMAKGGAVQHFAGGKEVVAEEVIKGVKSLFTPRETKIIRASEALAPHEGKYLNVTQSDRMRSTGGDLGGPGFSRFQTIDPAYEGAAWGVGKKPTASAIVNYNKRFPEGQAIWSPMIGSETQHHSNQHVFDTLANEFNRNVRLGKLSPELRQRANERLQKYGEYAGRFDPNFDIANPEMLAEAAKTFDRRGALAEVMSGKGVGGQKGSIIDYPAIMQEMTDPMTVGAPTHSIGTRLFNLTGEVEHRPDLHSAFPYILKGEDQAVAFNPIPKELALRDWMQNFRDFKGRSPGYYDMTRTIPSQQITEDYLRSLEAAGHAEGGEVKHMADGKLTGYLSTLENLAQKSQDQAQRSWRETASMTPQEMAQAAWEAAKFGGSFNPLISAGLVGSQFIDAAQGNTGWGEALGNAALNAPGAVGKAAHAVAPYVRQALPYVGGLGALGMADAAEAAPKPSTMKGIINNVMEGFAPKATKQIEAGAPHTYGPQATGSWVRDYQQSHPVNAAGLPTTREGWDALGQARQAAQNTVDYSMGRTGPVKPDLIQYMGKYRKGTPEERAAQQQSDLATIRMLMKMRGMD